MSSDANGAVTALDLRGTRCPLNYVKVRLCLDRMQVGDKVEVWLDHGEPEEQVPRSLRMDGQEVIPLPSPGDWFRVEIRRLV